MPRGVYKRSEEQKRKIGLANSKEKQYRFRKDVRELRKYLMDDLQQGMTIGEAAREYCCSSGLIKIIIKEYCEETGEDRKLFVRKTGVQKRHTITESWEKDK